MAEETQGQSAGSNGKGKKGLPFGFRIALIAAIVFFIGYAFVWITSSKNEETIVTGMNTASSSISENLRDGATTDNEELRKRSREKAQADAAQAVVKGESSVNMPLMANESLAPAPLSNAEKEELERLRQQKNQPQVQSVQNTRQNAEKPAENPYGGLVLSATTQYLGTLKVRPGSMVTLNEGFIEQEKAKAVALAEKEKLVNSAGYKNGLANNAERAAFWGEGSVPVGTILYGMIDVGADSDQEGTPVVAQIVSGPHAGTKFVGSFKRNDELMVVEFSQAIKDGRVFPTKAFAVDTKTVTPAVKSTSDTHFWSRWGALVASKFIQGLGEVITDAGRTVVTTGAGSTIESNPSLSWKEKMMAAGGQVGQGVSQQVEKNFDRPPTVKLFAGEEIGILILQ